MLYSNINHNPMSIRRKSNIGYISFNGYRKWKNTIKWWIITKYRDLFSLYGCFNVNEHCWMAVRSWGELNIMLEPSDPDYSFLFQFILLLWYLNLMLQYLLSNSTNEDFISYWKSSFTEFFHVYEHKYDWKISNK